MKYIQIFSLLFVIFHFSLPAFAQQPSFNCGARLSPNERLICSSPQLAQLDNSIAHLFGELTSMLNRGAADIKRQDQRAWLRQRQSCRQNYRCTQSYMQSRIAILSSELEQERALRNPPPHQNYGNQGQNPGFNPGNNSGNTPGNNQLNCGFFNMVNYNGQCMKQCPDDYVAGPDKVCRLNDEASNPNPCGPGFYQIKGLCISAADVQENNSYCGPGFVWVQNKCIHQNQIQFRP